MHGATVGEKSKVMFVVRESICLGITHIYGKHVLFCSTARGLTLDGT